MPKKRAADRPKSPQSARNALPKVKYIVRGLRGALLRDPYDGRSTLGQMYSERLAALRAHLGGELTAPQESMVDQAVRLSLAADIAWAHVVRERTVVNGSSATPAFETFLKATRDHRAVLQIIGLERQSRPAERLGEALREEQR